MAPSHPSPRRHQPATGNSRSVIGHRRSRDHDPFQRSVPQSAFFPQQRANAGARRSQPSDELTRILNGGELQWRLVGNGSSRRARSSPFEQTHSQNQGTRAGNTHSRNTSSRQRSQEIRTGEQAISEMQAQSQDLAPQMNQGIRRSSGREQQGPSSAPGPQLGSSSSTGMYGGVQAENTDPDSGNDADDEGADLEDLAELFQTQRLGGDVGTSANLSDGVYQ